MNTYQLLQALQSDIFTSKYNCHVVPLNHFLKGTFVNSSIVIFNYDNSDEPGSHWCAVYIKEKGKVEYFDSFGFPPLNEPLLQKINSLSGVKDAIFNTSCFQGNSSVCGQYSLTYLLLRVRGYEMRDIGRLFLECKSIDERDHIVNHFISQLYPKLFTFPLKVHDNKFS